MGLKLRKRFTEVILITLIILNIFDFLKILPGDMDFLKKVISWAILAHLFYEVSFTWLFFGKKHDEYSGIFSNKALDLGILSFYLLFSIKNLLSVSAISLEEVNYFKESLNFLTFNSALIEIVSFYVAGTGILLVSLYLGLFTKIQKDSLLGNLGFQNKHFLIKFLGIFLVLVSFYILVFELIIEWLAIAIDSTIIVLGFFVYFFLIIRLHKNFGVESLIFRLGQFGENFEEHFLKFFHDKKHVFLGLSGLLVLHLLTEISNFMLPYLLNLTNSFYFEALGHEPLYELFLSEFMINKLVVFGYFFNIFAILGLMIIPAVLWYEIYKNKKNIIPKWIISIFLGSLFFFILNPLFYFEALDSNSGLVGTNILNRGILFREFNFILMITCILLLMFFLLSFSEFFSKLFYHISIISVISFFAYYLYFFYLSTITYFLNNFYILLNQERWFFLLFFVMFLVSKILFVVVSFLTYVILLNKKHLF